MIYCTLYLDLTRVRTFDLLHSYLDLTRVRIYNLLHSLS
jgi:hypothetical protein